MNVFDLAYVRDAPPIAVTLIHVVVILLFAWLLLRISRKLIQTFRVHMGGRAATAENIRRIDTLAHASRYVISLLITLIASMMILSELGVSIAPILGAAGVAGIAVGFGAQSLIKDYFNGFFILLENQIHEGDVVEVSSKTGVVEKVTLRYILLRDFEGSVHFIPNGLITTVTNKSRGYAYAVIDVKIAYRESIDEAFDVMRKVGSEMRASPEYAAKIVEDIDIAGVQDWADSAVVLRCRFKVIPLEQWGVRREFLRRLKEAFNARGIEIPYPHVTTYVGQDKSGIPSALRILKTRDTS